MSRCNYYEAYLKGINHPLPDLARTFQAEKTYLSNIIKKLSSKSRILDIGCGVGRPLLDLARTFENKQFYGIDFDKRMIKGAKEQQNIQNISFLVKNASNTTFENEFFTTTYSTYNFVGCMQKDSINTFLQEQKRITQEEIISIFWNSKSSTTEFLKKYYLSIGINIVHLTDSELVTDKNTRRPSSKEIAEYYTIAGINVLSIDPVGELWVAVRGKKNV